MLTRAARLRAFAGAKPAAGAPRAYVVVRGVVPGVYSSWCVSLSADKPSLTATRPAARMAMRCDPATGEHRPENVVLSVGGMSEAERVFAYADEQGYVVQLSRTV
jgi:hypothetical protein